LFAGISALFTGEPTHDCFSLHLNICRSRRKRGSRVQRDIAECIAVFYPKKSKDEEGGSHEAKSLTHEGSSFAAIDPRAANLF
jgi:hypothetical protein